MQPAKGTLVAELGDPGPESLCLSSTLCPPAKNKGLFVDKIIIGLMCHLFFDYFYPVCSWALLRHHGDWAWQLFSIRAGVVGIFRAGGCLRRCFFVRKVAAKKLCLSVSCW